MSTPLSAASISGHGRATTVDEFRAEVRKGLTKSGQKELHSKYFYDEVGSALFDVITVLPEYGLTRADIRLLRLHAPDLAERMQEPAVVVELGSGNGSKTRWILSELASKHSIIYCPVDISESALLKCRHELDQIESVKVVPFVQTYLDGLQEALQLRPHGTSALVLFLGSSIGNFEPAVAESFVRRVREALFPGDVFYVSADLDKDMGRMIKAYDDPLGVTAAFNLNLLARINRELGGNFVVSQFGHEARYDRNARCIEMHVRSLVDQTVEVGEEFVVQLRQGETIWTESSFKFRPTDIQRLGEKCGFVPEIQWIDEEWPFSQTLLRAR